MEVAILESPPGYPELLGELPRGVENRGKLEGRLDSIQFFARSREELERTFPKLKWALSPKGMLWISWCKPSSGRRTDLDENLVREIGLQNGLVDVKVAAIDETWSALKFVYRSGDRR